MGVACCRVLGRCALVSGPPAPPPWGGLGVVGGLVVNCIVDASIDILLFCDLSLLWFVCVCCVLLVRWF